ncbi:MAG: ABC-F family ATP-binding cassette domain-containing protein [Sodaliphilus sp.]|nr:ABC-F family ATP-binding cassette domain-containing protein [Sodaliphilus sp.]
MISVQNLKVEFSSQVLFEGVSFVVNKKDKIALVGKNGAGKSTLLKIFAGEQHPTSGVVSKPTDITIGYLPQTMDLSGNCTVKEEVMKAFSHIEELDSQIHELNQKLLERTDYESESYQELIDTLAYKNDVRAMYQSENYEALIEKTLIGLGFLRADFDRSINEFSGGWRMRIELAKILLCRPDVLLLDEPTNHLDIESIQWLETFLKTQANILLLVSHDKAFIDNVTNRTIEISCGKIYDYKVNYSHFIELRKERVEQQKRAFENQQKMIQDTEEFIEKFRYKPTKSVQVQSRIKQLEKIERIQIDEVDHSHLRLKFPPAPRSGDYPVIADNVGKSYGNLNVFHDCTFTIKRGEKVAFVGKNGAGKSTMVKCIMNEIPFDGSLKIGHNVKIGYFAQNQAMMLDENLTVFDTIDYAATGEIRTKINDILGAFMFGGALSDKKVKVLSGGERSRLAMIQLLLQPVNLLILDEPTNHLDIRTKDILKEAIQDFEGTVIVVSHDRDFLNGLVEKVYEFGNGVMREHLGGIYDFLEYKKLTSLQELEKKEKAPAKLTEPKEMKASKLSYQEQKEAQKRLKQAEKKIKDLEQKVNDLEHDIKEIETVLAAGGDIDPSTFAKHKELSDLLESTMLEWEEANEAYESLQIENYS